MSNDISYDLVFIAPKKAQLLQVKSYLEDKKSRWDNRGEKTAADLLKETGLQNAAEIVCWGFEFGKIQQNGDSFSVEVTSWANENSLGNIWISGAEGELHFLLEKFPELEISGSFKGEFGRGSVCGSELEYESWNDDGDEDSDGDEESQELKFVELDPEQWEAARDKNQALAVTLASADAPGHLIDVVLPQNVTIAFCSIPAGSFTMGSPEDEESRHPDESQVEVTLIKPFWLAKTPVTQAQWDAVMGSKPNSFEGPNLPMDHVSWEDARAYLAKLNEKGIVPEGWKFALPTEAQWEYACRAGEAGPFSGGSLDEVGWYLGNSGSQTHEVGQKKPNALGLHDMHGNVLEWCADWYNDTLKGGTDPSGPLSGDSRVHRGGSCDLDTSDCRAACRFMNGPGYPYDCYLGFRPALVPSSPLGRPGDSLDVNQRQLAPGDVYALPSGLVRILITSCDYKGNTFQVAGLNGLEPYSDFDEPVSREAILNFLKKGEYVFVKNINDGVAALIAE
jgi:formylglycine-generating enzyme required for sulfatase activity